MEVPPSVAENWEKEDNPTSLVAWLAAPMLEIMGAGEISGEGTPQRRRSAVGDSAESGGGWLLRCWFFSCPAVV
ncbi:hypothetical protein DH86_00004079 [Scytalidium sp. 3C]|nr:hypothetical protein DH86_00004079 [Scytalidium sp. 3C]